MFRSIVNVFNKYPLAAPIVSAGKTKIVKFKDSYTLIGLLSIVGDTIAQHVLERKPWNRHDYRRTARLTLYGFLIIVLFTIYIIN